MFANVENWLLQSKISVKKLWKSTNYVFTNKITLKNYKINYPLKTYKIKIGKFNLFLYIIQVISYYGVYILFYKII